MTTHQLKTWPDQFRALRLGTKTFEVRKEDDRTFAVGDVLDLREWVPEEERYTGEALQRRVMRIARGPDWGLPVGLVVLGLKPPATADAEDLRDAREALATATRERDDTLIALWKAEEALMLLFDRYQFGASDHVHAVNALAAVRAALGKAPTDG